MSAVRRLFEEWYEAEEIFDTDGKYDREDLEDAFAAGWNARHNAHWVRSEIPMMVGENAGHTIPPELRPHFPPPGAHVPDIVLPGMQRNERDR